MDASAERKRKELTVTPPRLSHKLAARALVLAAVSPCVVQAQPVPDDLITVDIRGLHNDTGQVVCALFASAAAFPKRTKEAIAQVQSGISHGQATCTFSGIAAGRYAISVFHDENSNGRLDTNFMGIPREGVGASNNVRGRFGPPRFDAASFTFSGRRLHTTITITYL